MLACQRSPLNLNATTSIGVDSEELWEDTKESGNNTPLFKICSPCRGDEASVPREEGSDVLDYDCDTSELCHDSVGVRE